MTEILEIQATKFTPYVYFNSKTGQLIIKGTSIPEDPFIFFEPLLDWIMEYVNKPAKKTVIEISLNYYNTSSSKFLIQILKILERIKKKPNYEILLKWQYNDDKELEALELISIPYQLIK